MRGVSKVIDSENGKIYCYFNGTYKIIREYPSLVELFTEETKLYHNLIDSGFFIKKKGIYLANSSKFILEVSVNYK